MTEHPTTSGAVASDPTGLAFLLKSGTQDLHDEAEAGDFQKRMVDGRLLREEFIAFLQQVWHVHGAIEPMLRDAARAESRLDSMLEESHFRVRKIEHDLSDLGAAPCEQRLPSTERFIEAVRGHAESNPLALVGVLYVKEGATNGNKIVAKRIREALGLPDAVAMGYLDPHGPEQRRRWTAFKGGLNALELSDDEKQACVEAARMTFRLFMDLSAELEASVGGEAPSAVAPGPKVVVREDQANAASECPFHRS